MKNHSNSRRSFVKKIAAVSALSMTGTGVVSATNSVTENKKVDAFKLKYAPTLKMFKASAGDDILDNIQFCYDQGFRAVFDNGLMHKPKEIQEKIVNKLANLGMDLGPFVLYADFKVTSFVKSDKETREMLVNKMKEGVELAKRTNAKTALVVPGRYDQKLHWDYQTANVIENLRYCAEIIEPEGLTMVLEPLNALANHPGLFLTTIPQTYLLCKAVNSPAVKIVDDLYHQQITEGNLIPNIEYAYNEIAAFHLGDNPGRKEPTSGEINYKNVFKFIYNKGFKGVLCMEHGKTLKGKEGDKKVIDAYRECDSF